jgi:NADH-ubiquinone oxidoreductase chain 5
MFFVFSFLFVFFYFWFFFLFLCCFWGGGWMIDYVLFCFVGLDVGVIFVFDYVGLGFFCCVSLISGLVFLYRVFYMEGVVDSRRFVFLVFLFVVSMGILVFSGGFLTVMLGWDGLGLVSFCLVIFYGNSSSLDSGLVTVFRNRVGDVFFLVSFFFFRVSGWWSFDSLFGGGGWIFCLVLFLGSVTKRAQVPFSA